MPQTRQQRRSADRRRRFDRSGAFVKSLRLLVAVTLGLTGGWLVWNRISTFRAPRDGAPSWSPDSRQIAFYSERGGPADLWVMDATGDNARQVTSTPASEGAPAFSPDGTQLAFDTDRDGNFEIYVMTLPEGPARRLTQHPGKDLAPVWSRDGKKIAFMSSRDATTGFDVYMMNSDGTGVERVTTTGSAWFPQFSPEGRRLAFHVHRDVHVLDLVTKTLTQLTHDPLNGMYPTWSRDGQRLAFMSWRNGRTEIFTMNIDGTDQQLLVSAARGGAIDPRWSPDGTRIAYVNVPEETVHETQRPDQQRIIYVMDLATKRVTMLSR